MTAPNSASRRSYRGAGWTGPSGLANGWAPAAARRAPGAAAPAMSARARRSPAAASGTDPAGGTAISSWAAGSSGLKRGSPPVAASTSCAFGARSSVRASRSINSSSMPTVIADGASNGARRVSAESAADVTTAWLPHGGDRDAPDAAFAAAPAADMRSGDAARHPPGRLPPPLGLLDAGAPPVRRDPSGRARAQPLHRQRRDRGERRAGGRGHRHGGRPLPPRGAHSGAPRPPERRAGARAARPPVLAPPPRAPRRERLPPPPPARPGGRPSPPGP